MAKHGGRIPPDGRAPQAPGVGKNARRHDLERPKTPGLHGSDLQMGDVSQLEAGQKVQSIQPSNPGRSAKPQAQGRQAGGSRAGQAGFVPNPLDFAKQRFGGTLGSSAGGAPARLDPSRWIPFLQRLAASPRSSSGLTAAFIAQASNMMRASTVPTSHVVDMQALDDAVETSLK